MWGTDPCGHVAVENAVGREVKAAQGLGVVSQQLPLVDESYLLLPAGKLGPEERGTWVIEQASGNPSPLPRITLPPLPSALYPGHGLQGCPLLLQGNICVIWASQSPHL